MIDDAGLFLLERRKVAVAWLEWATRRRSVQVADPRYRQVVENRDKPTPQYSSCGDLAHWLLFRLGVRAPWINRAEAGRWRPGLNVSELCWLPAPARDHKRGDVFDGGDIVVVWSKPDTRDAHVICVVEHDPGARVLCTAEYGQRDSLAPTAVGGALKNHVYTLDDAGRIKIGMRTIHRVLTLDAVIDQAQANNQLLAYDEPPVSE